MISNTSGFSLIEANPQLLTRVGDYSIFHSDGVQRYIARCREHAVPLRVYLT